jgi:NAD(P)-dependent dehydrogenase (short-subunit alcohol dehydrogenase family)
LTAARLAIVTGAANGIGRASALRLARDGFDLAIVDREGDPLAAAAAEIERLGRRCFREVLDCTDDAAVAACCARIAEFGVPHVLFNNVGQSGRERAAEFWKSDPEVWRFVVNVSLMSAMLWSRQIVPGLRERRAGRIVNMSSMSAVYGDTGLVDYAAAKAGVIGFTRALARELAPFQVNVNVVAPGAIKTRAHDRLPPETIERIRASVPMGYVAEPEDVAHTVSFLASDGARYITGQTLLIDGGRWML